MFQTHNDVIFTIQMQKQTISFFVLFCAKNIHVLEDHKNLDKAKGEHKLQFKQHNFTFL